MNFHSDSGYLPLKPIIHSWIDSLIARKDLMLDKIRKEDSPVNIHSLDPFVENIQTYQCVFQKYKLKHKIYFARKANKCISFAQQAFKCGQGVDTASFNELEQCLAAGIPASVLILTAAVKNRKLLELAVQSQVTIVLDNLDEYFLLKEIVEEKQKNTAVVIRLSGFTLNEKQLHSRFGFSLVQAQNLIEEIHLDAGLLRYSGLHFHLNGYAVDERVAAIEQSIRLIDQLDAMGIGTESLDIGGGFLVNYLKEGEQWAAFHQELKLAVLGQRTPLTYLNDSLGIVKSEMGIQGEPSVYPYFNSNNKALFLERILKSHSELFHQPIHELIQQRNLELRIEPGRSLVDQAGVTVATVLFRKADSAGNFLVGIEMNRSQLRSSSADFLVDPIHLPLKSGNQHEDPCFGFLVGAYCLEQELILKRRVKFDKFPEVGDLILFPNTAGYMMHFFESEAHRFNLAANLFFDQSEGSLIKDG
ncbi:alanine racemase [Algoriphagus litoralis]|uniref:alanine racemase n=1 Tax=Algoriphagus litoralis TaxID=2202829 RepID=UPI000DBAD170|nr:alanine racemase [Algoriphagus litoralis]